MTVENNHRARAWCLTINNPCDEDRKKLEAYEAEYIIVGDEVSSTDTPHYQIYFRLKNAKTFSKIKKEFPNAHIERAEGNDTQNKSYCSKERVLFETGTPSNAGKRTDLEKCTELIQECPRMSVIIDNVSSLQSIRTAEKLLIYKEPKRTWKPKVLWFCGPTGVGKSKLAYELCPDAYTAMDTGAWWEGYDGHEEVIIDDMRKDFLKFHQLLKLLDRYPYRVEVKGGSRQFLAKTIIITSCYSPDQMFDTREDIQQLLRRIDRIKYDGYI